MLKYLNENAPITLTCPRCSTEFDKTPKEMKITPKFSCPKCDQAFDAKDLASGFEKADKMVGDLGKNISKTFKIGG